MFGVDGFGGLPRWVQWLLGGLFLDYLVVIVLGNFTPLPVWTVFALAPTWARGFAPWQVLTHLVVPTGAQVFQVLFGLLMLGFALPPLTLILSRRQIVEAFVVAFFAAVVGAFLYNGLGGWYGLSLAYVTGWFAYANVAVTLFGLSLPGANVRLMFVLPVSGQVIAYACGGLAALLFLAAPSTMTFYDLAAWGGVMGWWYLRGPGGRRRKLVREGRKIERQLQVLQGGRDDTVH